MIVKLQWIMEFLLLVTLLNIGLLKTLGVLNGENKDILDSKEAHPAILVVFGTLLVTQLSENINYYYTDRKSVV